METIFDKALALCKGNKTELSRRCKVTVVTIHSWKKSLTPRAELALEKVVRDAQEAV